jgi:hypothetical protein
METNLVTFLLLLNRYLHIIAAALLIGGTLFYELIVPVAIDELKDPQKLSVFARARWAFRWIVWCSMVVLLITGTISSWRNFPGYNGQEAFFLGYSGSFSEEHPYHLFGPGHWWLAHTLFGIVGLGVAVALVLGRTPPRYPLIWMRINLVILMIVIFLASTTRDIRHRLIESQMQQVDTSWQSIPSGTQP